MPFKNLKEKMALASPISLRVKETEGEKSIHLAGHRRFISFLMSSLKMLGEKISSVPGAGGLRLKSVTWKLVLSPTSTVSGRNSTLKGGPTH